MDADAGSPTGYDYRDTPNEHTIHICHGSSEMKSACKSMALVKYFKKSLKSIYYFD